MEKKECFVNIRITQELKHKLILESSQEGRSVGSMVRFMINRYLKK